MPIFYYYQLVVRDIYFGVLCREMLVDNNKGSALVGTVLYSTLKLTVFHF
jgi:hypothetical protein